MANHCLEYLSRATHVMKRNSIACLSVTGALALHLVVAWQPLEHLEGFRLVTSTGPLMDDSYIFFKISRDIADWLSGFAPSFQLTSGFQPLIALFFLPIFELFWNQKETAVHLALSLNAILGFCANILLYCLLRWFFSRPIATFLVSVWVWSPYVMNQTINGMETTLALLLLLIILSYYWRINHLSLFQSRPWFFLGFLIGIGFWARVDLVMVGVAIVLDQAWLTLKGDRQTRAVRVRNVVLCSVAALAVASPWIVFTFISTGNLMPISGRAVHQVTSVLFNLRHPDYSSFPLMMFSYFKKEFLLYQPLAALSEHISWQLFTSVLSLFGLILSVKDRQIRILLRPVWIFQTILVTSYILLIGGFWHLNRYLYPVYTLMLFLHATTLYILESRFKLRPWISGIIFFLLFVPYAFSYTLQYHSFFSVNLPSRYLSASLFAKAQIPPKAKVGTFQSGCLGYWLDNEVINLDGVINEKAYFHLKNKSMDIYLEEKQIDYLVEEVFLFKMWDDYLGGQLSKQYTMVTLRREKLLRWANSTLGIYKRKR